MSKEIVHYNTLYELKLSNLYWRNQKNVYLKITKILNIIKVLDILLIAEISEDVYIAIGTFITCEYIVIWYYYNLFTVPNLQRNNENNKLQNSGLSIYGE